MNLTPKPTTMGLTSGPDAQLLRNVLNKINILKLLCAKNYLQLLSGELIQDTSHLILE